MACSGVENGEYELNDNFDNLKQLWIMKTISMKKTRKAIAFAYGVNINECKETPIGQIMAYRKAA